MGQSPEINPGKIHPSFPQSSVLLEKMASRLLLVWHLGLRWYPLERDDRERVEKKEERADECADDALP